MVDYNSGDRTQGALFKVRDRKSDKHPAMRGELTLTKALLKELIEEAKANRPIKLSVSAWNNTSRSGIQYISLSASKWVDMETSVEEVPF